MKKNFPPITILIAVLAATLSAPSSARAQAPDWKVTRGEVRIACPLTVGGSFEGRSSAITGSLRTPSENGGVFGGELRLDLTTIDTGIDLRNRHMRENYLEVDRGPDFTSAVLSALAMPLDDAKAGSRRPFTAVVLVHGVAKPISGTAEIRTDGATARVEARFPIRLADHGIPPPRYLGVGVKDEVQVLALVTFEQPGARK